MSFYGVVFRLFGWVVGLGLIMGELSYYEDGRTDDTMVAAGVAILLLWAFVLFGPMLRRSMGSGTSPSGAYPPASLDPMARPAAPSHSASAGFSAELAQLAELRRDGMLTADEYAQAKGRLLDGPPN